MRRRVYLKRIASFLCMLFIMISIFLFSSQPREESNAVSVSFTEKIVVVFTQFLPISENAKDKIVLQCNGFIRKCAHFSMYAVLGIATLVFVSTYQERKYLAWGITLTICVLYAASDEFHQLFVPGRGGQLQDVLLDFCGSLTGSGVLLMLPEIKKIQPHNKK